METNKPMTKIEALRKTIYNLENNVYEYDWYGMNTCNCGVLARTILGGELPDVCGVNESPITVGDGCFAARAYCMTTKLPLPKVFESLRDCGFTHQDLLQLEFLSNPKIVNLIGYKIDSDNVIEDELYTTKKILIKYLKAWVEILEEEDSITQPVKETKPVVIEHGKSHKDITSELAVLPINETSDLIVTNNTVLS